MDTGYYKHPETGKITKGSFEDAWKVFINKIKDEENNLDIKNKIKEVIINKLTENKPCWKGYKQIGMKDDENGKKVPNCVPKK